jgi:hypothetical protein
VVAGRAEIERRAVCCQSRPSALWKNVAVSGSVTTILRCTGLLPYGLATDHTSWRTPSECLPTTMRFSPLLTVVASHRFISGSWNM